MEDLALSPLDVPPGHLAGDVVPTIARCLETKGFCLLATERASEEPLGEDFGDLALRDIRALVRERQLRKSPRLVADGLLGQSGSAQILELDRPDAAAYSTGGESLRRVDELSTSLGQAVGDSIGSALAGRTHGVLCETSPPGIEEPELTDQEAGKWLNSFARARLMILHFLGPATGTLELRVHGEEESEPFEISTGPGMTVVLRAELLLHEHRSEDTAYALVSFWVGEQQAWSKRQNLGGAVPAALALDRYLLERMQALKERFYGEEETALASQIPRAMQRTMNRLFLKGDCTAVRGSSFKLHMQDMESFHKALVAGADFATEVPHDRWDHSLYYHPDPDKLAEGKLYCMHMTCLSELDMFDNKFFLISVAEASRMDPNERHLLELGYAACYDAGLTKKNLMNSDCGVYVAWTSDASGVEDRGMGANRINFCLGCKGPSLACDVDHASALVAVRVGCAELGRACSQSIVVGCQLHLVPSAWLTHCATHMLSPAGRTCSFDANASGFIRADGLAGVYVKKLGQSVDGQEVWDDSGQLLGVIQASVAKSQGRSASLRGVDGACLQEVLAESTRMARIAPLDVDFVECDAKANPMFDAVEVCSSVRALRPLSTGTEERLALGTVKMNNGSAYYAAGLISLIKLLGACTTGTIAPSIHMHQLNPLIESEIGDVPVFIQPEAQEGDMATSFMGVTACGWGGTNANVLLWGKVQQALPTRDAAASSLCFWPGGGGALSLGMTPARAYTIAGTWSCWGQPQEMEDEGDGVYGYTVTLGDNCWELFQIWLDGDETQVLHPGQPKAPKGAAVEGPDAVGGANHWLIDGRPFADGEGWGGEGAVYDDAYYAELDEDGEARAIEDADGVAAFGALAEWGDGAEWANPDLGWPGAEYRVRLRVAGKWRTVEWERVSEVLDEVPEAAALSEAVVGRYFVSGSWNAWGFDQMTEDPKQPGCYWAEVLLYQPRAEFQIVRNEDWHQTFYPRAEDGEVLGPDDEGTHSRWEIAGKVGDTFRVEFRRAKGRDGFDSRSVSWRKVRTVPESELDRRKLEEAQWPRYFLVGSWDGWRRRREMWADADGYAAEVLVRPGRPESFQVLENGSWDAVLYPSLQDAGPAVPHAICGPAAEASGAAWTIGSHPSDGLAPLAADADAEEAQSEPSVAFEVRLLVGAFGPVGVTWQRL